MSAESFLMAIATASLTLSSPTGQSSSGLSPRPLVSTLAAQGSTSWLFPGQQDKRLHAMGCALISSLTAEWSGNPWLGMTAGVLLGTAKEVLDGTGWCPGERDFRLDGDLGADLLGSAMGTVLYFRF
ncbi:MAG TPA: hypothetical protein DD435_01840 [Cyanobacteria bacterium UBA8530]|nr:hypothetical protein [Cyanobacteria bacterium UBA8530]